MGRRPAIGRLLVALGVDPARCGARRLFEPRALIERDRRDEEGLRRLLAFTLRPDSCCLDVGAYVGGVLSELCRLAPAGRHIAWEPVPRLHRELAPRFPGVDVRLAALSDRAGSRTFTHVVSLPAYSGFRERAYPGPQRLERIDVRTERLDDALPPGYAPDLVKVDVEGAEGEVLAGGIETIARHRPVVVFEHQRGAADRYGTAPADVWRLLCEGAGLRIFDLDGDGPYDLARLEDDFRTGRRWNFVAHAGLRRAAPA